MLRLSVCKRWRGFKLHAQLEAPTPGVVALFGRSGCGKTTVINIISGLLQPDEGRVELDGVVLTDTREHIRIPVERRRIGYVFQDARLFPHLGVLANLRYGLRRAPRESRAVGLEEVLALLGLEPLLGRRTYQLSGGERQRVALGRALLSQPRLLLLDEPLSALDAARREEVLPYLERLRDSLAIPMVYVSHQLDEVLRLATHMVLMEAGEVVASGVLSDISLRPELRAIVGSEAVGAVLDGEVTRIDAAGGMTDVQLGGGVLHVSLPDARVGARIRVQLLARDIILATEPPRGLSVRNALQGVITELADEVGNAVLVKVDIGSGAAVLARVTRHAMQDLGLRPGRTVWVLVKAVSARGHAFAVADRPGASRI
ncbi:MAG TPA: molybdenum ABC transporter ATP-binding protein [Steroidobacteraceae bacterium]|nr:molybdenum ABC transporter ATP-binding protein [Steroidobacteraceae bacterium]